jgi:hypothetical protein
MEFLHFELNSFHSKKIQRANVFGMPVYDQNLGGPPNSYFTQLKATAGQHSLIIYDPRTDKLYARDILVDVKVHNEDLEPKHSTFSQKYNSFDYDIFKC